VFCRECTDSDWRPSLAIPMRAKVQITQGRKMISSTGGVVFHMLFTVSLGSLRPIKADVELNERKQTKDES